MKRKVAWIAAALLILPALLWVTGSEDAAAASEYTLTVLNPQGPVKKNHDLAPRLNTLEGKKIAMWLSATEDLLYAGKGAELYDLLEKMLKDKYPDIEIVSYRDLPMKYSPEGEVVSAIVEKQPDGVVAGFGG
jgi:ABC-type amino acid transport substrate-binding protein